MTKKKILICISLILCFHAVTGQHETDIWYFGTNAGMDFNSGVPVNLTNGLVNTTEGSSSICDPAGNLLFYTDGITVWNQNHLQMANGFGLHGGFSSSQSALIVKMPQSDSLYYIFTTGEAGIYGLEYSVVDMSLQSNLGEVTTKNVPLVNTTCEKVTASLHSNGTDIWIITHRINSNVFVAFVLTASGVNMSPVISNIGSVYNDHVGYLKASHSGSKLAAALHNSTFSELYDFDASTGAVSNPVTLDMPPTSAGAYGVEFSPNDQLLYITAYTPAIILQWDISTGIDSVINNSMVVIDTTASTFNGALQLATDGKIYMARYTSNWTGVINNPDTYGSGCNYVDDGFNLSPNSNQLGLPNFAPYFFSQSSLPVSDFSSDTSLCEKFCLNYFDQSVNAPTSWEWLFNGGNPSVSTDQNPVNICYDLPGVYAVTLITSNAFGTDTLVASNYLTVYATPPSPTITQNGYILTSSPSTFYQWQLNAIDIPGATNQSYTVTQSGFYTVVVTDEHGCVNSASADVLISGVTEAMDDYEIQVTPNPSDGIFTVSFSTENDFGSISIKVLNGIGQQVYPLDERSLSHFQKQVDLSSQPSGVYLMEIRSAGTLTLRKIVVAK